MGTTALLFWNPLLPWSWWLGLAIMMLIVLGYAAYRRRHWTSLVGRGLLSALILLALAQPSRQIIERQPQPSIGLLVRDASASVALQTDAAALDTLERHLQASTAAASDLILQTLTIPDGVEGTTTPGAAIRKALASIPAAQRAGVIIISDGQWHDNLEDWPQDAAVPVNTVLVGAHDAPDAVLRLVNVPAYALVGKEAEITVRLDYPQAAAVTLFPLTVRSARSRFTVPIPVNQDTTFAFPVRHRGDNSLTLSVDMADSPDAFTINNQQVATIQGIQERLRVLLVSGSPYAGGRTWRDVFTADPMVDLIHFTILRPPEKQDAVPRQELSLIPFPVDELFAERLYDFDLIIFDRYEQRGVLNQQYLQNIAQYVENGGALLMTTAPSYASGFSLYNTPLGAVLPAAPSGEAFAEAFTPERTEAGQFHPITRDIPTTPAWGQWLWQVGGVLSSGQTLLTGIKDRPLLVVNQLPGRDGRVALLLSDQIWLWKRGFDGGGPYNPLLKRLVHWLMREPALEAEQLRAAVNGETLTITRQHVQNPLATVTVEQPDGQSVTAALTNTSPFEQAASLPVHQLGWYRVSDGKQERLVAMGAVGKPELLDIVPTATQATALAEATRGAVQRWQAGQALPALLFRDALSRRPNTLQLHDRQHATVQQSRWEPLLPLWGWGLVLVLAGVGVWWRESRSSWL